MYQQIRLFEFRDHPSPSPTILTTPQYALLACNNSYYEPMNMGIIMPQLINYRLIRKHHKNIDRRPPLSQMATPLNSIWLQRSKRNQRVPIATAATKNNIKKKNN